MPEAVSGAPVAGQTFPPSITEIALERRCFGCQEPYKLTFERDGAATHLLIGVARQGTVDRTRRGTVTREDFARLAALIQSEGFLDLNDDYRNPTVVDGQTVITSVVVDGRAKVVVNSNEAGPTRLKAIEDAIDALGSKVTWTQVSP